ncbi:MAG: hypothetical protein QOF51_1534 [Chloroflexota bacterium]|nr:hypothetical protein [Chloroflexota bacterium]
MSETDARQPSVPTPTRTLMPEGYGINHATPEGMVEWDTVVEQLTNAHNYWVCTTRPHGRPHVAPVWGLWLDGAVHFSTDPASTKGRNLAANPACVVHLESGDDVVIVEGVAERITDPAVLGRFADAYEPKYAIRPDPSNPDFGFYRVRHSVINAWREKDFPTSTTRWHFVNA